ncbi:MAG: GNAT family N-acetyltransferase [Cytophagaceae bacterium]|jgi:hypothetical protein|nr:GNAT family N-acetyltransferase [Cytophagaceae bacterium]
MTDKEKYTHFCETHPLVPVYMRNWWLDCNCGANRWNVLLYENGNGGIEAFMTYFIPYARVIAMPYYSQSMGIWFNPEYNDLDIVNNTKRKHTVCNWFIERLPSFEAYRQNFHYTFTDWLPFYWKGFKQTTRYTYVIPDISDTDALWKGLHSSVRKNINRARNHYKLTVRKDISYDDFFSVYNKTYQRQNIKTPGANGLKKIIEACEQRNQGSMWGAYDGENRLHAVLFVAWQDSCAYGIASGRDPDIPNSEAQTLLHWECIRFYSGISKSFDFQGSMMINVEYFFRKFGGILYPYFQITKGKRRVRGTVNAIWYKLFEKKN